MGVFLYEGLKDGRKINGRVEAPTKTEAVKKLREDGILPLSVREAKKEKLHLTFKLFGDGVSEEDISFGLYQLSVLLRAGIPLVQALDLLSSQVENKKLSSAFLQIKTDVEKGESLSEAFKKVGIFPEFLSEMLTAAETGENLERVFEIVAKHLETISDMKSKVLNAITYPSVVIGFSFLALVVAIKFVVPKIAGVLESLGKDLPLITKAILFVSDAVGYSLFLLPVFALVFFLKRKSIKKEIFHRMLLRLPVAGRIALFLDLSRLAYTLSMTLASSVPLVRAYRIAVKSLSNTYLKMELEPLAEEIERGRNLSWVFKKVKVVPSLFVNLVETGENSGELEKMLSLLADLYRREALKVISFWIRLVEPLSILIIGVIVGIIVISVILPLTEITSGLGR